MIFFTRKRMFPLMRQLFSSFKAKIFAGKALKTHTVIRYLVKELLLYFGIAFLFFFAVFFVNQILLLAENILKKHVPVWDAVLLITYCLPFIIAQSAPFATLVGFLMCLGNMMSTNEILILRASGFSYRIILLPVLVLGLFISIFSFFVNDYLLPLGTIHYNRLYRSILMSNPAVELEPHSIKRMNDSTLVIGDVKGNTVSDLVFFNTDENGTQRIIIAGNSEVKKSKESGVIMQLDMKDAHIAFLRKDKIATFDALNTQTVLLNIFESSFFDNTSGVSPREMTSYDLYRKIGEMRSDKDVKKRTLNLYQLEYNKKFSLPFGSLFFALMAMPLAILFGKHNGQTIGLIIGLFISVLYWAMMILGQIFSGKSGSYGILSMWFPNLLAGFVGISFYFVLAKK